MTPLDAAMVRRKLTVIGRNVDHLEGIEGLTLEEYMEDFFRLKGTERALQETVEAAVDINLHILRDRGAKTPLDYFESFIAVGREKVIPSQLAEALAPSAGLRNRIIHEYENIDDGIILGAVGKARQLFPRYVAAIEQYLNEAVLDESHRGGSEDSNPSDVGDSDLITP